jgi:hypothetical protein
MIIARSILKMFGEKLKKLRIGFENEREEI